MIVLELNLKYQHLVNNNIVESNGHSPFKLIFIFERKSKSFTEAGKNMLKLVKLPSLVPKYCKTWKIYVCKFCIVSITLKTKWPTSGEFRPFCGKRNTKVYKICKLCKRIFSVFYNISPPNLAVLLILTCSF